MKTRGPAQGIPKAKQKLGVGQECAKLSWVVRKNHPPALVHALASAFVHHSGR